MLPFYLSPLFIYIYPEGAVMDYSNPANHRSHTMNKVSFSKNYVNTPMQNEEKFVAQGVSSNKKGEEEAK